MADAAGPRFGHAGYADTAAAVRSAVLVPLFRDSAGDLRVVVILRADGGRHGGQIGFPGGKLEPSDGSLIEAAIREAREEIGLTGDHIRQLERLPEAVTQTTGFRIAPFLAWIERPEHWRIEPREVQRVMEPRLHDLQDRRNFGSVVERHPSWDGPRQIDFFKVEGLRLWGASYRILEPLLASLTERDAPI